MWIRATASSTDLLWRVKSTHSPRHLDSRRRVLVDSDPLDVRKDQPHQTLLAVSVIDYHSMTTTILDSEEATAEDLELASTHRWESRSASTNRKPTNEVLRRFFVRNPGRSCPVQWSQNRRRPPSPTPSQIAANDLAHDFVDTKEDSLTSRARQGMGDQILEHVAVSTVQL